MAVTLLQSRRRIITQTPHLETASGNPALFSSDVPAALQGYKITFGPSQSGSGTPSPDNIRGISHPESVTVTANGQTYTIGIPVDAGVKSAFVGGEIDSGGAFIPSHAYYKWEAGFASAQITSITTMGSYTRFWIFADGCVEKLADAVPMCNILPVAPAQGYADYDVQATKLGYSNNYPRSFWVIMPTSLVGKTATSIRNYLAGKMEVAYPCSGGSYSASCPAIPSVRGENSIGHNLSGTFQAKYWTH